MHWIPAINATYHLGADGIAIALILLTTLTTILVILGAWDSVHNKVAQYLAAFLVLEGLMIGVFAAMDALLFYVFFEGMLIPMFIIIGIWGGPRRVYATLKFFLYTFFGSIFMLIGLIYLYLKAGSWEMAALAQAAADARTNRRICSSRSCSASRSRCRCGRCIHGCRTRTSKRRPAARSSWPRSC